MKLAHLIKPELIKIGLSGKDKNEIMWNIAENFAEMHGNIDKKEVFRALSDREKKGSTGIGGGLAIPHGKSSKIEQIQISLFYDAEGKDFEAYDKKLTNIYFVLLIPEKYSPHDQLELLRLIAEIFEKTDIAEKVKTINTNMELYELLIKKEEQIS